MTEQVTAFKTSDGKLFLEWSEANTHEIELKAINAINKSFPPWAGTDRINCASFLKWLDDNRDLVEKVLKRHD